MSGKQETSADIIAEMRFHGQQNIDAEKDKPEYGILTVEGRIAQNYADRLEAAWRREKAAIEADALTVGGMVEASRTTAENSSVVGNAAAIRHALAIVYDWILKAGNVYGYPDTEQKRRQLYDMMTKALAAPARNCDLARDWLQDLYCKFKPPASVRREMPPEWVDAVMAFCKWLVAQAKDAKGENNANK